MWRKVLSSSGPHKPTRRDFLLVATSLVGVTGAAWPFIDQLRPDESVSTHSFVEVDVSSLQPGSSLVVRWRGKPVFIRHRTDEEMQAAEDVAISALKDQKARNPNISTDAPATNFDRSAGKGKEKWLVMIGVCTHLGCVPIGQRGDFGGWFCPCHGSHFDTAGRIRKGPATKNLEIPPFTFISDKTIRIG